MRAPARYVLPAAVATLALCLAVVVPTRVDAQSLDEAREQRAAVQVRLDEAAQRMARLEARVGSLSDETAQLEDRVATLRARAEEAQATIAERVRDLYKRGIDTPILQLLGSDDAGAALERAELANQLLTGDRVALEEAAAARQRVDAAAERLTERRDRLAAARQELESTLQALRDDLQAAQALEERLEQDKRERAAARRRERREARAAAEQASDPQEPASASSTTSSATSSTRTTAASSGGMACPVGAPRSYTDTWGAPRSGGRSHEGTDILADYGTPVYAIVSGSWDIYAYGSSAGNWAILHGDDGNDYWYMHLQRHVVGDGARVSAGTQVATNGDTGNASGTPHVHFEYHPGGGGPVNPYPRVRSACG